MRQLIARKYQPIFLMVFSLIVFTGLPIVSTAGENTSRQETTLESITVTANKQEENVQEVPIGISVFDDVSIEDKNIDSVLELADFIPNFMLFENGLPGINSPTMRGVCAPYTGSLAVSTGMFIDGIPVLSAFHGFDTSLLDIERIEVLRGPQGTLYGKNTEAGAINIITRQPDNTFRGKISADGGEDKKKELSLNISGPIVQDRLFFNVTGQYYDKEGFILNGNTGEPANDKRSWYGKGGLYWNPVDALNIQLSASILKRDDAGNDMGLGEKGAIAYGGLQPSKDRKVYSDLDGTNEGETSSLALKVEYDFSEQLKLTSITAHRKYKDIITQDFDYNPVKMLHSQRDGKYQRLSQELRLSSETARMRWVAGVYCDKNDNDFIVDVSSDIPMMNFKSNMSVASTSYAVFGQLRYALTSRLAVTGGLRYEKEDGEIDGIAIGQAEESWDDIAPKIAIDYRFSPAIMGYASAAKGFRAGGFNSYAERQDVSYNSEILWSYEVGGKTQWFDNRLLVNGALFYMDIDDMQVTENPTPVYTITSNAAKATGYGAEIEIQALITRGFTLTGSFGYTHIEFDEFTDALGDYKGNTNPFAPEYTFSIGGQYRMENGLYAGIDFMGYSKMYFDKANQLPRDAYQLVNAKIGYEAENWDIYLYGKNIFDKEYNSYYIAGGFQTIFSPPREVGVKLTYRF